MRICRDQRTGHGCGTRNKDSANHCQQCGMSLRFALELHNPGTIIGTYRILETIGYGGFGAVYAAEDTRQPGLRVALKETFDPTSIRAFQEEFAVLHRLQHDHLPQYYAMFEAQGNGYLVMELIPGQNLEDVLGSRQGQPLVEAQVLGYALQVCEALTYLHRQNPPLVHRDIKPANIRLTPDGLVKLVDFGLLKQGTDATRSSRMGLTLAYAPPEQWGTTGTHTTPQSDLYSLGASLYHLLTGQEPPAVNERLTSDTDALRSPRDYNPRLTAYVADALLCAMALRSPQRFADAATFKQALMGGSVAASKPSGATTQVVTPGAATPAASPRVGGGVTPVRSRLNPLFPVTIAEWSDELLQRNEQFGNRPGYWCYVRPGNYVIGGWERGNPVETLTLPGFWIAKYPITVQQYRQFLQAGGYTTERYWTPKGWKWKADKKRTQPYLWENEDFKHLNSADTQPAVGISWYEASAFAAWLNTELADSLPAGYRLRLPTEAEWEAAAAFDAAGKRRTYPWGEQEPDAQRADFNKNWRTDSPAAVGEQPAGAAACGAQALVGSVREATCSRYGGYPLQAAVEVADFASNDYDVPFRGGAWGNDRTYVRCAARGRNYPVNDSNYGGFRLVLSL